jgi:hypothetical protein
VADAVFGHPGNEDPKGRFIPRPGPQPGRMAGGKGGSRPRPGRGHRAGLLHARQGQRSRCPSGPQKSEGQRVNQSSCRTTRQPRP